MRRALITGVNGQDGSYLAELLLEKGYEVWGMVRRSSSPNLERLEGILPELRIVDGDLTDLGSLIRVVEESRPDEVYNLAAQSFVGRSWKEPLVSLQVTAGGAANLLEAVRLARPGCRFYQASSSELFGRAREVPQNERTPFYPRSPYGAAKLYAHWLTVNYRESHGLHACSGILFNHESPRRGLEFVTRKVSRAAARIALGLEETLRLGNLRARRDWGFAGDYVEAMWRMLQRPDPQDYVIATGTTHSVGELVEVAFAHAGLDWRRHVAIDPALIRPAEVDLLVGDATRARGELGWTARVGFEELVGMMVDHDLARGGRDDFREQGVPARRAAARLDLNGSRSARRENSSLRKFPERSGHLRVVRKTEA